MKYSTIDDVIEAVQKQFPGHQIEIKNWNIYIDGKETTLQFNIDFETYETFGTERLEELFQVIVYEIDKEIRRR